MRDGFAYLRDTPVPSVTEAKKMLQKDLMEGAGHLTRTRTRTRTLTLTLTLNPLHSNPTQVLICTSLEPRNAVESVQEIQRRCRGDVG